MSPRAVSSEELATPLVPYEEAVTRVLAAFRPLPPADVPLREARGLVAAEPVAADGDVPPFEAAAMDGYAVAAADTAAATATAPVTLRLAQDLPAGSPASARIEPGTAAKIMTGAPLPRGADAVVPWEKTEPTDGAVSMASPAAPGANVRRRGEYVAKGDEVVAGGTTLTPAHLGVLASLGRTHVRAHPRPRVAILSSGDELVPPGRPLGPGQVHDVNSTLLALLCEAVGATVVRSALLGDDPGAIASWMRDAVSDADLVVTSAGASVGERDWLREVLGRHGEVRMWRVAMKPGKPTALGRIDGTPVLALPGNPDSAFTAAHAFVLPALRVMAGRRPEPPTEEAVLDRPVAGTRDRLLLCPVQLREGRAIPVSGSRHIVLADLARADGVALIPAGGLPAGAAVRVEITV